jgi:molybdate transport system ATP-binding protein
VRLLFDDVTLPLPDFTLRASFEVETNALGIFGPSGAGKTTLMEMIAGVRTPDRGRIVVDDVELTSMKSRDRHIGYVPQDDTLFPHMSVRANVMCGVQWRTGASHVRDEHWISRLEIESLLDRHVAKLSGGERRRIALARALATQPRLLLLDEVLAGLDDARKQTMIGVLCELQTPILFVSHERDEIAALCEHVVSIDRGQCSPPASLPQRSFSR